MLNPGKVELNTRLLTYEQGKDRESLLLRTRSSKKGQKKNRLVNTLCGLFGYLCLLALIYFTWLYNLISFSDNLTISILIAIAALIVGIIFVSGYVNAVDSFTQKSYRNVRNSLSRYDSLKKKAAAE